MLQQTLIELARLEPRHVQEHRLLLQLEVHLEETSELGPVGAAITYEYVDVLLQVFLGVTKITARQFDALQYFYSVYLIANSTVQQ